MSTKINIAVAQMCSRISPEENLNAIAGFAQEASAKGAHYLLTPEMSVAFGESAKQLAGVAYPYGENVSLKRCAQIARTNKLYLHIGSLAVRLENGKFANRSVFFDPDGNVVDFYDKIHLFDADVDGDDAYRESDNYVAGSRAVLAQIGDFKLGMSICYDIRFANLYREYARAGADFISVPSAFTVPTGKAHWEILLRARAIETGCYVVAAAQGGPHENGRQTYGYSMIVDPWGEIVACMKGQSSGLVMAQIDREKIGKARQAVPQLINNAQFCLSVNHDGLKSSQ